MTIEGRGGTVRCSVIIANFNGSDILSRCLTSLLAAISPTDEIIVVDNGSTDGSVDFVNTNFPKVKLVRLSSNRYIFGLNDGLRVAAGKYVAFCNNDMEVEPSFIEEGLKCFVSEDVFAVCARVLDRNGDEQGSRTSAVWRHGLLFYEPLNHTTYVTGCFFAVGGQSFFRRDIISSLGSIDELLWPMYHEDIELSYRAWKAGYRILYAPESVCHHLGGYTSRRVFSATQLRSFVRQNELLTVWKNVNDPSMLLEHALWFTPRIVAAFLRRDKGTLQGTVSALRRLPAAVKARRQARALSRLSDRDVLKALSGAAIDRRIDI